MGGPCEQPQVAKTGALRSYIAPLGLDAINSLPLPGGQGSFSFPKNTQSLRSFFSKEEMYSRKREQAREVSRSQVFWRN